VLTSFSQVNLPFARKAGDYLPLNEAWEIHDAYILEITPKNSGYCYSKKILQIDKQNFSCVGTMSWDAKGTYWRESLVFYTPVKLLDGRFVFSTGTAAGVDVQNGRSTALTASSRVRSNTAFSSSPACRFSCSYNRAFSIAMDSRFHRRC
jgi:hypothetical protein